MTPLELNRLGYRALMDALGFDGMMRFLQQFEPGQGDYTAERQQCLQNVSLDDIFAEIEHHRDSP
ncbi:hypothetical protein J5X98_02840 [Leptothermofonsia sichuanensis E412]|nr:hypothetical protein J5X98_02840 [Leptothermofonsia sichuanensis E412]